MLFLVQLAQFLLTIFWWIIIIQVVLSWLILFNVLNLSSNGVRNFIRALDRIMEPIYRPIRKVLPDFGGLDFSPLILLLVISFLWAQLNRLGNELTYLG